MSTKMGNIINFESSGPTCLPLGGTPIALIIYVISSSKQFILKFTYLTLFLMSFSPSFSQANICLDMFEQKLEKPESKYVVDNNNIYYRTEIDGKPIEIEFIPEAKNHFTLNYSVRNQMGMALGLQMSTKMKILKEVELVLKDFILLYEPSGLAMQAYGIDGKQSERQRLYTYVGAQLQRFLGGRTWIEEGVVNWEAPRFIVWRTIRYKVIKIKLKLDEIRKHMKETQPWSNNKIRRRLQEMKPWTKEEILKRLQETKSWTKDELHGRLQKIESWPNDDVLKHLRKIKPWTNNEMLMYLRKIKPWTNGEILRRLRTIKPWANLKYPATTPLQFRSQNH